METVHFPEYLTGIGGDAFFCCERLKDVSLPDNLSYLDGAAFAGCKNLNSVTLTIATYTYVSRGNYGIAAAYATILTVTTIISLLTYMKITGNKEVSF